MAEQFELGLLAMLAAQLAGSMLQESLFVECPCGTKLDRVTPRQAYGIATALRCDGCQQNIGPLETCFHCPRGRTMAHPSGYDVCETCAQKKAQEQAQKDEENAPKMPDPLKLVRCRCGSQMDFIPVRLKYRAPCKCDECGDAVPRLSYVYHCPKDRLDEHRTVHGLFDYCFACAYKRNPTLANSIDDELTLETDEALATSENNKESASANTDGQNNAENTNKGADSGATELETLKRNLQQRSLQIRRLELELERLREAQKQSLKNESIKNKSGNEEKEETKESNPTLKANILDAILQSELHRLGLPSDRGNAGKRVNEITTELVNLGTRQSVALQWLSNGEIKSDPNQTIIPGIWNHVTLNSLQTLYGTLDILLKQFEEMAKQVTTMRMDCLVHISKKQDDWENWSPDEVVDWISAVENGRFLKYDAHLRKVLNERSFKGKHMKTLKFDRLAALGVTDYEDADILMNCVGTLIKPSATSP